MTITAVQTAVFDTFQAGYPGQVADIGGALLSKRIRSFRTETQIVLGRGVVKGTANGQNDELYTPYGVKTPLAGSVSADVVGIAVLYGATSSDANNNAVAFRATTIVPVAELGSADIIFVKTNTTQVDGDPVYMSVSHATIPVGEFSNAAATGLILVTGAVWYGASAAGTVGRIKI